MPVTPFQKKLVRLLAQNRTPDSHLAGGAALNFKPQSIRYSNDLDYFHDSEARVGDAFNDDRKLLLEKKYRLVIEMNQPGYIRSIVSKENDSTKIEWAHDSAWRFMPAQYSKDRGYYLHFIDLAVNKVLTLAGRDEARDYIDIHEINKKILELGPLCWAACGKDPGFTPNSLLELLKRRGKYQEEEFFRLKMNIKVDLLSLKTKWLQMLDQALIFIENSPPEEVGCIYYSLKKKRFVSPDPNKRPKDIVPHYGCLGGIIPRIID